jgi:hypothetical protein
MEKTILPALALLTLPAAAHDWYSDRKDPVTATKCCGGKECHRLDPDDVTALPGGNFLIYRGQHRIPRDRVQVSEDDDYHICEVVYEMSGPDHRRASQRYWICFFAPSGTSAIEQ